MPWIYDASFAPRENASTTGKEIQDALCFFRNRAIGAFDFWTREIIILMAAGIIGYYTFQVIKKLYKRARLSYWQILFMLLLDFLLYPFMILLFGPFAFFRIAPPLYFELAWLGRLVEFILWVIVFIYFMKKVPFNLNIRSLKSDWGRRSV